MHHDKTRIQHQHDTVVGIELSRLRIRMVIRCKSDLWLPSAQHLPRSSSAARRTTGVAFRDGHAPASNRLDRAGSLGYTLVVTFTALISTGQLINSVRIPRGRMAQLFESFEDSLS